MPDPLCHATTVTYGGIQIRNVLTDSIASETVYDRSGVDPIGVRTRMTFVAEIHGSESATTSHHGYSWTSANQEDVAIGIRRVIDKFLQPRKRVVITMGSIVLFDVIPSQVSPCETPQVALGGDIANQDIANGPRTTCQVLSIKGDRGAKCRFTVEFVLPLSCINIPTPPDILNVRWRVNDDIECQGWLTRRTYEGVIRFRTRYTGSNGQIAPARTAHYLARQWALPPLLRGFRRESLSYHEDQNALEISFVIVDQEIYSSAPSPATFWDGTYTMSLGQHAAFGTQSLSFVLKADKLVHKTYLMQLASYIIDAKMAFRINRPNGPGEKSPNRFLASASFTERLSANEISVNMETWSTGKDAIAMMLTQDEHERADGVIVTNTFGEDLPASVSDYVGNPHQTPYDPEITRQPYEFSAGVSLMLASLQTPCCPQSLGSSTKSAYSKAYETSPATKTPATPVIYKRDAQLYDEKQNKSSYAYYRMSSELVTDTGWRAFPLGKQCSSTSSQATVAFSHLHCPVQIRKVTINAMRINAWPELPKPVHWIDDTGPRPGIKHILKSYTIEPMPVQTSADGCDTMHEVLATYYYYLDRPYEVGSQYKMPVGRLPYISKQQLADNKTHREAGIDGDKRAISQMFFLDPKELLESFP